MKNVSTVFVSLLLVASVNAFAVDDRGNTATQGAATWLRAAQYMMPKPQYVHGHLTLVQPIKVEVSQLMDPGAPQSPFATLWSLTPHPTLFFGPNGVTPDSRQAIFGHAGNGEDICGEIGQQGTQMDALGHFGFINEPGETPTYFGGLTQSEVVGPTGLKRLGIDQAEPIITSVVTAGCRQVFEQRQGARAGLCHYESRHRAHPFGAGTRPARHQSRRRRVHPHRVWGGMGEQSIHLLHAGTRPLA